MTGNRSLNGVFGAGMGLVTLLLVAGDTVARVAPDRLALFGHARLFEALTAMVVPALYLLVGRLSADMSAGNAMRRSMVRGLLGAFLVALAARMIDATSYGVDPTLALVASLHWPDGAFIAFPGLALFLAIAPRFSGLRPFFVLGLGAGLTLSQINTTIVAIDIAAANAVFFAAGLVGARLFDSFVHSARDERGEVLFCSAILVGVGLFLAGLGIATAPVMAFVLGAVGVAAIVGFATELSASRAGGMLNAVGARLAIVVAGAELPLALIGRGPTSSDAVAAAILIFVLVSAVSIAYLANFRTRRSIAGQFWRVATAV